MPTMDAFVKLCTGKEKYSDLKIVAARAWAKESN
jgi:hypothetical protein